MRLRSALVAATILALPVAVKAQPVNGLYIGGGGGMSFLQDQTLRGNVGGVQSGKNDAQFNYPGAGGLGSVGYGLGNGFRVEIEGDYFWDQLNRIHNGTSSSVHGQEQTYGVMANALYDFNVGLPFFFPYLGAGVGYQWLGTSPTSHTTAAGSSSYSGSTTGNLAYQAIAGFAIPISYVPGLSFTAEYRMMSLIDPLVEKGSTSSAGAPGAPYRQNIGNYFNHMALVGLRYAFGVTPPPPPPPAPAPAAAPAPAPARTYLVFFDWDRADLTDRARQIVGEAAQASTHVQYTRIEVDGYTDRSGTPAYNQKLSVRRAEAVAAELVRDGVPKNVIDIQGFGETHPLVPTAAGVREPQNRRVEISLKS